MRRASVHRASNRAKCTTLLLKLTMPRFQLRYTHPQLLDQRLLFTDRSRLLLDERDQFFATGCYQFHTTVIGN